MGISSMNYIDFILLLVIGLAMLHGIRKGFIEMLMELSIWLGSFLISILLSKYIASLLNQVLNLPDMWVRPISFIILLVFSSWLISTTCDALLKKTDPDILQSRLNAAAGVIPGLLSGFIYAGLLSFFIQAYPLGKITRDSDNSSIVTAFTKRPVWLGENVIDFFVDLGMKLGSGVTLHPQGGQSIDLPFTTNSAKLRKDLEQEMLGLLNNERKKAGISILKFDDELAKVARQHSLDMFHRGYFSHYSPDKKSPFNRIREAGINYLTAGENLALAQNLKLAHEGLMQSPTHKANILNPAFGRIGIGIYDGGIHGIIVTQNFRN